jgi:hypothetical protein
MVSGASLVSSNSCAYPQMRFVDLAEHKALVVVVRRDEPGHGLRPAHLSPTRLPPETDLARKLLLRRTRDVRRMRRTNKGSSVSYTPRDLDVERLLQRKAPRPDPVVLPRELDLRPPLRRRFLKDRASGPRAHMYGSPTKVPFNPKNTLLSR